MPTWRNDNLISKWFPGTQGLIEPDQIFTTIKYPYPRPSGFTLISHEPRKHRPWELIFADELPAQIESGCAKFAQIEILNKSGALVTLIANEDTAHPRVIPDGEFRIIEQDYEIDALEVTGEGGAMVYIYGMRIE